MKASEILSKAADLKYPAAVGHLQAAASFAAIDIESIVRNVSMDAWAKEDLLNVARKLRAADKEAESMCSPEQEKQEQ